MTEEFFQQLTTSPPPALNKMAATIRLDIEDGPTTRHWLLTIDRGTVQVSHRGSRADAVIRINRKLFERVLTGDANAMAATLRGEIAIDGDRELLVAFQRLISGSDRRAA